MPTGTAKKRLAELLAIVLIGDAVVTLVRPARHSLMWWAPLPGVRELMTWCARHPNASRAIGLAQLAFGLWFDARQYHPRAYQKRTARR